HGWLVMLMLLAVIGLNVYLFIAAPKGFFPQQDTGQLNGGLRADQSISFQAMQDKLRQLVDIIRRDPAVDTVVGFTGGGRAGGGFLFVNLKPVSQRKDRGQAVIARLRPQLGLSAGDVDNALYDAFGQRQVATIYDELNQYHVIMEVAPRYARSPEALNDVQVAARGKAGSTTGTNATTTTTPTTTTTTPT